MAAINGNSLAQLLHPVSESDFFNDYWERKPLLITRNDADWYKSLFDLASVDAILTTTDLRQPAFRLVKDGIELPPDDYTFDLGWGQGAFERAADIDRVLSEYQGGVSIVLQALHRNWPAVAQLCRSLEKEFTHSVQANAYLTPRGSQGFKPHYDTHCVFIVQVSGEKHWKLYQSPIHLPHDSQKHGSIPYDKGSCQTECILKAGDLLYIPRGIVHEALTGNTHSLHLTIGVTCTTWIEVIEGIASEAVRVANFRVSLPRRYVENGVSVDRVEQFRQELIEFVRTADIKKVVDSAADRFVDRKDRSSAS
jgi:ribosomal protein L16 Arg81 hydroxylase